MVNDKELKEKQQKALDMIKAVYQDGFAEINGNRYDFAAMTHKKRRKVFAFFTGIASELSRQSLEFLDTERFEEIERLMFDYVLYDGVQLSKQADHFESFPGDYVMVVTTALQVISLPFMGGSTMNSTSEAPDVQKITLKSRT
ncbi:TPA: hypothetical protein PFE28_002869 [Kluyvera cryocrescens]|uniref:hypothetical protein n=1 Tax=Kluyvera cryocrescens TaxID=580 RepID=UPI000D9D555E|nr:hypothetical protein [Kluyvera cryocrescens]SQC34216.1 Uncharacterised protein [Kluyvera cryocrescens]HDG1686920.1 hypothetical protein [Kluyvera cryocrescens]